MALKGYLPPEGPQNVHTVPYSYAEGSGGSHRVDDVVIYGPEAVILTGNPDAQDKIEQYGLTQVPQQVAQEALEAYQSDDEDATAEAVIEEWQEAGGEPASEDDAEEAEAKTPEEQTDGVDGPAIPSDLGSVPYRGEDTLTLQHLAQAYNIPANQSAPELREALAQVRDS